VTTVRLDLEYDGSGFSGWASQPGLRTVQGEVSAALQTVLRASAELTVAGRTDAGVHAWGQVASFELDGDLPDGLARSLNGVLTDEVTIKAASPAADGFHARHDARSRTYCYRVLARATPSPFERGRALWFPHALDVELLQECAELLPGTHDFTAFTPTDTEHRHFHRTVIRSEWRSHGDVWEYWVEADAFMRNMVRVLVGTMLDVATGRREVDGFARLLEGASREAAGDTARPHGLYLASVRYEGDGGAPA
jgi:tRNA pseudouridine38-40 synthase